MCHSMVKNHNYGNTPLLNGEIEEIEGCQCSQTQPFFARERMCENHSALLGHKTKKYYLFILFPFRGTEIVQRNVCTMRGCFVSLTQVVNEDVISKSSDLSGMENTKSQKTFQRDFHSPDSIRSVSVW